MGLDGRRQQLLYLIVHCIRPAFWELILVHLLLLYFLCTLGAALISFEDGWRECLTPIDAWEEHE